jgi:hypothetical protein
MKAIFAALIMIAATSAFATEETYPGGCKGKLLGTCEEYDNGTKVGPNYVTCIARDSANQKFTYTGSYGKPTKTNVQGAINACKAGSDDPASCHWTACVWAD